MSDIKIRKNKKFDEQTQVTQNFARFYKNLSKFLIGISAFSRTKHNSFDHFKEKQYHKNVFVMSVYDFSLPCPI